MRVYHQCGHNFVWNLDAFVEEGIGDGLILSPVNIEADKIVERFSEAVRAQSWFDPQFYLPHDNKGKLETYPFFPGNVLEDFTTADFSSHAGDVAQRCVDFQTGLDFQYVVMPTRYFAELPGDYLEQLGALFVEPFTAAWNDSGCEKPLVATHIVRPSQLADGVARDELLSWLTGLTGITGIYVIFDNDLLAKQIKDPACLVGMMRFIHALRQNDLEVHVGYCGLEGLLLSCADPTSVTVGSYENLRSFGIQRLETQEPQVRRGPRPRIYSQVLLQSIEDTALPPLRELLPDWEQLFSGSRYTDYLVDPDSRLNSQRPEVYKHYFAGVAGQVTALPGLGERASHLRGIVENAISEFDRIRGFGIYLDGDSDGSHLPAWMNALAMFEVQPW